MTFSAVDTEPKSDNDRLYQNLSTLPRELTDRVFHYLLTTSTQAQVYTYLTVSRKTYEKSIQLLYRRVSLHKGNAEKIFYGLGPRFEGGGVAPTLEYVEEMQKVMRDEEMERKPWEPAEEQAREEMEFEDTADNTEEEEWARLRRVRETHAVDQVGYTTFRRLTTVFIRKYYMLHGLVLHLSVEDPEALLACVEAGQGGDQCGADPTNNPNRSIISENLVSISLGPKVVGRLVQARLAWQPSIEHFFRMCNARSVCIRLPETYDATTFTILWGSIASSMIAADCDLEHITIHGVNPALVVPREMRTEKVRLFLREPEPSEDPVAAKDTQLQAVVSQLLWLANRAETHDASFPWHKPEYLNFLSAESSRAQVAQAFQAAGRTDISDSLEGEGTKAEADGLMLDARALAVMTQTLETQPALLSHEDTGYEAVFKGKGQGEACRACGGR